MPNVPVPAAAEGLPSSRRALLAGLALAPFAAAPVAASLAEVEPHPDAALLALEPGFLAAHATAEAAWAKYLATSPERWAGDAKLRDLAEDQAQEVWDEACAVMSRQATVIVAIPAVTLAGLIVKARCLRLSAFDEDDDHLQNLVNDLMAMSGGTGGAT